MSCRAALLLLLLAVVAAPCAARPGGIAVLAVGDAPEGPDAEVAALAGELRAACRARDRAVMDRAALRARLAGPRPAASVAELARAFDHARAAFGDGQLDAAEAGLRGVLEGLERQPEGADAYALWTHATLQLAYVQRVQHRDADAASALDRLAAVDPELAVDEVLYPPSLRAAFAEARRRMAARPHARLVITSDGPPAVAYVNGRRAGATPVTLRLPPGRYRVGGIAGALRALAVVVDLGPGGRTVALDLALAAAARLDRGPGLALAPGPRVSALARAGATMGATRVVAVSRAEVGGAPHLDAALVDVERGEVVRAARLPLAGASAGRDGLRGMAAFLLAGEAAPELAVTVPAPRPAVASAAATAQAPAAVPATAVDLRPLLAPAGPGASHEGAAPSLPDAVRADVSLAAPSSGSRRPWARPAAYATGAVALGLAGVTVWQALAAQGHYGDADGMVRPDGSYVAGASPAARQQALDAGDASTRAAYLAAVGTVVFAGAAAALGYLAWTDAPPTAPAVPVARF